jgi:hypothetical protein
MLFGHSFLNFFMEPYLGDLEKTQILSELFEVPKDKRDDVWKDKFLASVLEASFCSREPQIVMGPDGFPYFALYLPEPNKAFQCFVIKNMKDDFLLEKGIGVVISPGENSAEWVFSYGDIVNYHLNGKFYTPEEHHELSASEEESDKVLVGQPAEDYLPKIVREVLRRYLATANILDPKILLMVRGGSKELVFNMTVEMFESPQKYEDVMNRISWFLPRHYVYSSGAGMEGSLMPL